MTQLHTLVQPGTDTPLVVLADRQQLEWAEALLSPSEASMLRQLAQGPSSHALFTGSGRLLVVELLDAKGPVHQIRESTRKAAADRLDLLRLYRAEHVAVDNRSTKHLPLDYAEGLVLANYQFLKYFKEKKEKSSTLRSIGLLADQVAESELRELQVCCEAVCLARDLVNEPVSYLTAEQLSKELAQMGSLAGFSVQVLDKTAIESLGMGGLLSVNRGSQRPPTFTVMEYRPANARNARPVVLVGKGVVFDTGGLSLKPTLNSMDSMKCDMAGAAAVGGILYAAAKAQLPVHLVGLVPATDNRPGEDAYVPGDVITISDGTTVEVLNCDAEGRLILADALHYAKQYQPQLVVDFATLTGAAAVAIGTQGIVYMGTAPETVKSELEASGLNVRERLVEFPLWDDYADLLKSDIADLKNIGGSMAGAITAGKFLQHFTDYPWLHLDIAGGAFLSGPEGYRTKGGTGQGVRLLFDFLKNSQLG
jgi:leucyl aminopeptidase